MRELQLTRSILTWEHAQVPLWALLESVRGHAIDPCLRRVANEQERASGLAALISARMACSLGAAAASLTQRRLLVYISAWAAGFVGLSPNPSISSWMGRAIRFSPRPRAPWVGREGLSFIPVAFCSTRAKLAPKCVPKED